MKRSSVITALIVVAAVAGGFLFHHDRPPQKVEPVVTKASPPKLQPVAPMPPAPPPAAALAPPPDPEAMADADRVTLMVRNYRTRMGGNPVGSNAEIMHALMGGNPKGAMFGPPEGQSINSNGELVDRWGTPYFFHQLSASEMEVRSAGPDRIMWTADDIVTK